METTNEIAISKEMYEHLGRILSEIDDLACINDITGSIKDILDLQDLFLFLAKDLPKDQQYTMDYISSLNCNIKTLVLFLMRLSAIYNDIKYSCREEGEQLIENSEKNS